ncbi:hypothetical protein AMS68_005024 [Peltaster fructicola]|uniref:Chromatin modification-related protein n=1 Tax=Peltaster fructicola TaxID=286661 RepID=A0A6H0XXK7_9PEZI|nr:hypothetical protein AMS68_005024 [Peltaster fructicola]
MVSRYIPLRSDAEHVVVANTPAEVTFLLEEIQAKDSQIMLYKDEISKRDTQLQKWVRVNGGHVLNPKEEAFSRTIQECYDKCEILQAEKCGLAEKAAIVLERQLRRLDVGLRGLMTREEFPSDWNGPSLVGSGATSGVGTPAAPTSGPLQAVSSNIGSTGGMPNIGNAAQIRMAAQVAGVVSRGAGSGVQTPASAPRSQRESSSEATKRRRLNTSLGTLPAASSSLRQSSIGPGTPKAGTPNPVSSRAGSAQPSQRAAALKKAPAGAVARKLAPPQPASKKRSRPSQAKKRDRRGQLARPGRSATPSSVASGSAASSRSNSPTPDSQVRNQADATAGNDTAGSPEEDDDDDAGEDGEDTTLYCFCQKVSFGDMVGCDNDNCKYQWFHWGCVNLKHEPAGEWLCPECRKLPPDQIAVSK